MASSYPTPYTPRSPSAFTGSEGTYLIRELRAISLTLAQVMNLLPVEADAAPAQPQNGMVRKAVAPWRPVAGQSADRWVIFNGTAWEYLE